MAKKKCSFLKIFEKFFVIISICPAFIPWGVYLSWVAAGHYLGRTPQLYIDDPKDISDDLMDLFYIPTVLILLTSVFIAPFYPFLFATRIWQTIKYYSKLSWLRRAIILTPLITFLLLKFLNPDRFGFDTDPAFDWFMDQNLGNRKQQLLLDIIDEELAIAFCDDNKQKQYSNVISQIPDRDNLYAIAFSLIDTVENAFVLLKIDGDKLDYWNIDTSKAIAKEHYPEAIENQWYVYPINEVKEFLVNYGDEYIEVNQPDAKSQYVDDSPLTCS